MSEERQMKGEAWVGGKLLGEVEAMSFSVEIPSVAVPVPWKIPWWRRAWAKLTRQPVVVWRSGNKVRSGTIRIEHVDSEWARRVWRHFHPPSLADYVLGGLGYLLAGWLVVRAARRG